MFNSIIFLHIHDRLVENKNYNRDCANSVLSIKLMIIHSYPIKYIKISKNKLGKDNRNGRK